MLDTSNEGFGGVQKILEAFEVERFIKKLVETQAFVQRMWLQIFWGLIMEMATRFIRA